MSTQRLVVAALAVVLAGCELFEDPGLPQGSVISDPASLNGSFRYSAWDPNGRLAVIGTISFNVHRDSSITGNWDLRWAPGADTTAVMGPQLGTGTLLGRVYADLTLPEPHAGWGVDMNPGWADNNVGVGGIFSDQATTSTGWSFSGFPGLISRGHLVLERLTR